jgi:multidrug resistance efflux pump
MSRLNSIDDSPRHGRRLEAIPWNEDANLAGTAGRLASRTIRTLSVAAMVTAAAFTVLSLVVELPTTVHARGVLQPAELWTVRATGRGRVSVVLVRSGDVVAAGQMLARLDAADASATEVQRRRELEGTQLSIDLESLRLPLERDRIAQEIRRAEAEVLRAKAHLRDQLAQYGITGNADSIITSRPTGQHVGFDRAVAEVMSAEAGLRLARTNREATGLLSYELERLRNAARLKAEELQWSIEQRRRLDLLAPATGRLATVVDTLVGKVLNEGDAFAEIVSDGWKVVLRIQERDVRELRIGQLVRVAVPSASETGTEYAADVTSISAQPAHEPGPADAVFLVEARLRTSDHSDAHRMLRRGFAANGTIVTGSRRAIAAIQEAVFGPRRRAS